MTTKISAYFSKELQSWVRLEPQCDGEYCHTSGYETYEEAMGLGKPVDLESTMPAWLLEDYE